MFRFKFRFLFLLLILPAVVAAVTVLLFPSPRGCAACYSGKAARGALV